MANFFSSLINNPKTSALKKASGGFLSSVFPGTYGIYNNFNTALNKLSPKAPTSPAPSNLSSASSSKLQGADYYKNLASSGNPTEQKAGQSWLLRNPQPQQPAIQPQQNQQQQTPPPITPTQPTTPPPQQPTAPTSPQVGTPMQNAQNVLDASNLNNNPQYQALASQNSLLTQAQNNLSTAGLAGSQNTINQKGTDLLGNQYSDLFRPQSTANLQGEKGILNPYLVNAEAGNTAEANRLLAGGQLATQGAQNVLGASLPQAFPYTSATINPLTGQPVNGGGGVNNPFGGGQQGAKIEQGSQYQGLVAAHQSAQNLQGQLSSLIQSAGINAGDINAINSFFNKVATNVSDPNYQTFNNLINDLSSIYAQILTPTGGSPTDMKTAIAQSLINAGQKGSSIMQVIQNLDAQTQAKMAGIYSAGTGQGGGSGGGGIWDF